MIGGTYMKLIRRRRRSVNSMLGITQAKRRVARATGIPTTKSGRKRKAMNALTGGAYGRYQRTRAAINRPFKIMKSPPKVGCLISLLESLSIIVLIVIVIIQIL